MNIKPYLTATFTGFAVLSIQVLASPNGLAIPQPNHHSNSVIAQNSEEQTRIRVNQKARSAVVYIYAPHSNGRNANTGSGFIVNKNGLVITNAHVLQNAASKTVTVVLDDERRLPADIIGFAKNGLDLAAIKIRNQSNLPTLSLAKSVKVGQSVYAIGSPLDIPNRNNFSAGVLSNIDTLRGVIKHDARINSGNSGGPLLNSQAEVIGVNTAVNLDNNGVNSGISIAISVDKLQGFLTALRQGNISPDSTLGGQIKNPAQLLTMNGRAINDDLTQSDNTLEDKSYFKTYIFEGKKGQEISIEMNSREIDPFLQIRNSQGEILAVNDDIAPNNLNARIAGNLPEDGKYIVIAGASKLGISGRSLTGNYAITGLSNP